jgi:hypothetical protein
MLRGKLRAKLLEIVDLAIVGEADLAARADHGLTPTCEINDRQATMTKADASLNIQADIVWTSVSEAVPHGTQYRWLDRLFPIESQDSDDAAHTVTSPSYWNILCART